MLVNPRERYFKNKGIEEGMEQGMEQGKLDVARNLLREGFSIDDVVRVTGLSKNDILKGK